MKYNKYNMSLTLDSPVSDFIAYVEEKNLYNSFNKMLIYCDNTLKELLGVDSFAFFGLERIIKQKKEKNMEGLKKETLVAEDTMSLEEIAAHILAKLHELPMDMSGNLVLEKEDTLSESTPKTPEMLEYEEEEVEDVYENYDEFIVSDKNMVEVHFVRFEKNGVPIVKINEYMFEEHDFVEYAGHLLEKKKETVDKLNEGIIIGILSSFLVATFFSLWLSFVNVSLSKMG